MIGRRHLAPPNPPATTSGAACKNRIDRGRRMGSTADKSPAPTLTIPNPNPSNDNDKSLDVPRGASVREYRVPREGEASWLRAEKWPRRIGAGRGPGRGTALPVEMIASAVWTVSVLVRHKPPSNPAQKTQKLYRYRIRRQPLKDSVSSESPQLVRSITRPRLHPQILKYEVQEKLSMQNGYHRPSSRTSVQSDTQTGVACSTPHCLVPRPGLPRREVPHLPHSARRAGAPFI